MKDILNAMQETAGALARSAAEAEAQAQRFDGELSVHEEGIASLLEEATKRYNYDIDTIKSAERAIIAMFENMLAALSKNYQQTTADLQKLQESALGVRVAANISNKKASVEADSDGVIRLARNKAKSNNNKRRNKNASIE